ncbi:MAG: orotate phosphoribosyltransferase [Bacteroidetes bacterium]|nr:MAG: orotate phosphoribosyltransferase [Bacteroidota bacterium]
MNTNKETSHKVAEYLLQIKAINLNTKKPFEWSSGLLSPIYCDNRIILSYPTLRTYIRQQFVDTINENFGKPDVIAGVATGGIAHGVLVAQEFGLPFIYVRPEPKKYGLSNAIEGYAEKGQSVIVIEDLISTGSSSLKVIEHLKNHGCIIKGMISIFTYNMKTAQDTFKKNKLQVLSLSNFDDLLQIALEKEYITDEDYHQLKEWHKDPEKWSNQFNGKS